MEVSNEDCRYQLRGDDIECVHDDDLADSASSWKCRGLSPRRSIEMITVWRPLLRDCVEHISCE